MTKTLALLTLSVGGCSPQFFLYERVRLVPDTCVSQHVEQLGQAVKNWNREGAGFFLANDADSEWQGASLPIECGNLNPNGPDSSGGFIFGEDYTTSKIVLDSNFWLNGARDTDRLDLLMHELGHSLGMVHVADSNAIMYPSVHGYLGFKPQDFEALRCAQTGGTRANGF